MLGGHHHHHTGMLGWRFGSNHSSQWKVGGGGLTTNCLNDFLDDSDWLELQLDLLAHLATSEDLQAALMSMQKMQAEIIQKVQAEMATSTAEMHQQLSDKSNHIESLARTYDSPSTVMGPAPCMACRQVAGRSFLYIPLSCPSVCCLTLIAFFSAPNLLLSTPPTHQSTCSQVMQLLATATLSPMVPAGTTNPPHSPINCNHHPQWPPCLTRHSTSQASCHCVQMGQPPLQGNSLSGEYEAAVQYLQSEANYRGQNYHSPDTKETKLPSWRHIHPTSAMATWPFLKPSRPIVKSVVSLSDAHTDRHQQLWCLMNIGRDTIMYYCSKDIAGLNIWWTMSANRWILLYYWWRLW